LYAKTTEMADLVCFATQRAILTLGSNSRWASDNEHDDLLPPFPSVSLCLDPDRDPDPNQARRPCIQLGEKVAVDNRLFSLSVSVSLS